MFIYCVLNGGFWVALLLFCLCGVWPGVWIFPKGCFVMFRCLIGLEVWFCFMEFGRLMFSGYFLVCFLWGGGDPLYCMSKLFVLLISYIKRVILYFFRRFSVWLVLIFITWLFGRVMFFILEFRCGYLFVFRGGGFVWGWVGVYIGLILVFGSWVEGGLVSLMYVCVKKDAIMVLCCVVSLYGFT